MFSASYGEILTPQERCFIRPTIAEDRKTPRRMRLREICAIITFFRKSVYTKRRAKNEIKANEDSRSGDVWREWIARDLLVHHQMMPSSSQRWVVADDCVAADFGIDAGVGTLELSVSSRDIQKRAMPDQASCSPVHPEPEVSGWTTLIGSLDSHVASAEEMLPDIADWLESRERIDVRGSLASLRQQLAEIRSTAIPALRSLLTNRVQLAHDKETEAGAAKPRSIRIP